MFAEFEQEFTATFSSLNEVIKALKATLPESPAKPPAAVGMHHRSDKISAAQQKLNTLKELHSNMTLDSNGLLPKERVNAKQKLDEFKKQYDAAVAEFQKLKTDCLNEDRRELTTAAAASAHRRTQSTSSAEGTQPTASDHKAQLAAASQTTAGTTQKLKKGLGMAVQMNEIADDTLIQLDTQRKAVDRIADTTADVDEELTQIQRLLRQMQKTMMKNKAVMASIILLLVIMIIALLYYKFGPSSSVNNGNLNSAGDINPPPPLTHMPDVLPEVPAPGR